MTPEQQTAAAVAGAAVSEAVATVVAAVDHAAHVEGLHVPPRAAQALATLAALGFAWTYNGHGMSCPDDVRKELGL